MATKIIYREAKKNQISTAEHIYNKQEKTNADYEKNQNYGKQNTLIFFGDDGRFKRTHFIRNGNNENLINQFDTREKKIDAEARADYKQYKTEQKKAHPEQKIRTVLQTKNLKKEFGLFLGGDKDMGNKEEFEKKILATVKKIMQKKRLEDKNIISIAIHYDEKTPHCHVQYNDYSFKHKTTGAELQRVRTDKNASKQEIKEAYKKQIDNFSEFQDLVSDEMGMERGEKNSKAKNKTKFEFYNEVVKSEKVINGFTVQKFKNENTKLIDENNSLKNIIAQQTNELNNLKNNDLSALFEVLGLDEIKKCNVEKVKKILNEESNGWLKNSLILCSETISESIWKSEKIEQEQQKKQIENNKQVINKDVELNKKSEVIQEKKHFSVFKKNNNVELEI